MTVHSACQGLTTMELAAPKTSCFDFTPFSPFSPSHASQESISVRVLLRQRLNRRRLTSRLCSVPGSRLGRLGACCRARSSPRGWGLALQRAQQPLVVVEARHKGD